MSVKLQEIMDLMEQIAPASLAESWDNPGLAAGDPSDDINRVLVALDAIEPVIDEAIAKKADLILTHHPILFRPVKTLRRDTPKGKCLSKAIKNDIALFSAHTNLDIAKGGTNDELARVIGLENIGLLIETERRPLNKIVVYAPVTHTEEIKSAMFAAGAGCIGNYSDCAFFSEGKGSFRPLEGTNPYIGSQDKYEIVPEASIETICPQNLTGKVISAMLAAHPYEEAAYDIYTVNQSPFAEGLGRTGFLKEETTLREFALFLKQALGLKIIRIVGDPERKIKKISLCTGAGSEFIETAAKNGSDLYITGDISYHDAQLAYDYDIALIDATHYGTENLITEVLKARLKEAFPELDVIKSEIDGQPFIGL